MFCFLSPLLYIHLAALMADYDSDKTAVYIAALTMTYCECPYQELISSPYIANKSATNLLQTFCMSFTEQ